MKTVRYLLPAHWATYLINGDDSAFFLNHDEGDEEIDMIENWLTDHKLGSCLDCSDESRFSWHNDGPNPNLGGDVMEYLFEERENA